jgi:X-X-X-Leu-X-X-Gly heptad repeat protein
MFVCWQSRKCKCSQFGRWGEADVRWTAVLADTKWLNGRPRQQHIAYLGSITKSAVETIAQRCFFWDDITARLDRLKNKIEHREKIEAAINKKVPRPTPEQYKDHARDRARLLGWDYLGERERAALQDEADQWKAGVGDLAACLAKLAAGLGKLTDGATKANAPTSAENASSVLPGLADPTDLCPTKAA